MRNIVLSFLIVSIILALTACAPQPHILETERGVESQENLATPIESGKIGGSEQADTGQTVTIGMVGDVLIHDSLINGTHQADDSYDFRPIFEYLKAYIEPLDIAAFDMEGTFRGAPYSGYPSFSTPEDLAPQLKEIGFDIGITANNHALDFGVPTMHRTVQVLRDAGLETVGTRLNAEEDTFIIKNLKGLQIGFSAWTYESERLGNAGEYRSLNNQAFSEEEAAMVDSFYSLFSREDLMQEDAQRIKARVKEMREAGAEFIVFFMHWGTEYMLRHDDAQAFYAQTLADAGVDLVMACGPHVIQPIRSVSSEDGKHEMLCYYSVGNCISNQQFDTGNSQGNAQDGLLALVRLGRNAEGKVVIEKAGYLAHSTYKQYPQGKDAEFTKALSLPLEAVVRSPNKYELGADGLEEAKAALARVQEIMGNNKNGSFEIKNLIDPQDLQN